MSTDPEVVEATCSGTLGGIFLGSVAQQAAHHARCPLVLVSATRR